MSNPTEPIRKWDGRTVEEMCRGNIGSLIFEAYSGYVNRWGVYLSRLYRSWPNPDGTMFVPEERFGIDKKYREYVIEQIRYMSTNPVPLTEIFNRIIKPHENAEEKRKRVPSKKADC